MPPRERVVQDVEIPSERTAEFLRWFMREGPDRADLAVPAAAAPAGRPAPATPWPLYPLAGRADLRQRGVLVDGGDRAGPGGRRPQPPDRGGGGRARRPQVRSTRTPTTTEEFWQLYGGDETTTREAAIRPGRAVARPL